MLQTTDDQAMPLTKLHIPDTLDSRATQGLCTAVHRALVSTCGVPESDRFQLVTRYSPGSMLIDPHFPDVNRSDRTVIVEILFLTGRTDQQKRSLYQRIAEGAASCDFRADDLIVTLVENTRLDWSMGGGRAFADVGLH
jgi:4-oxalocrotonate tautomerase